MMVQLLWNYMYVVGWNYVISWYKNFNVTFCKIKIVVNKIATKYITAWYTFKEKLWLKKEMGCCNWNYELDMVRRHDLNN